MPKKIQNLQLKNKFLLILAVVIILLIPPLIVLYLYVLFPTYDNIEKGIIKLNMRKVLNSILKETSQIDNICYAWSIRYGTCIDNNSKCLKDRPLYGSFVSGGFDFVSLTDSRYRVIFAEGYDTRNGSKRMPSGLSATEEIEKNGLIQSMSADRHRLGIIHTEYGFMITSVRIVPVRGVSGKAGGFLIIGKFIDEPEAVMQSNLQNVNFNIMDINGSLNEFQSSALETMKKENRKGLVKYESDTIYIYFLIPDIYGNHTILIEEKLPSIIKGARKVILLSLLMMVMMLPVLLYIIWLLLGRYVLKPVNKLKEQINTIAQGNYKNENRLDSGDEIGDLSLFIDNMAKTIDARNEELQSANRKLELLTITDGLTGIFNRRYFDNIIRSEWKRAMRNGSDLSVIMCDIDFFKNYNDMYGHQAGDECLKTVAGTLKDLIHREGEKLFRYGGEEFIAVLPNTNADTAVRIAISFLTAVAALEKKHEYSAGYGIVTISSGVASAVPEKGTEPGSLVGMADSALYKSKQEGRNRVNLAKKETDGNMTFSEYKT